MLMFLEIVAVGICFLFTLAFLTFLKKHDKPERRRPEQESGRNRYKSHVLSDRVSDSWLSDEKNGKHK